MKRFSFRLFGLGLLVSLAAALASGGGFQLNEHGARAMAQGGAWAARASDLSSIYFNPAGLTHVQNFDISLGATLIFPSSSFFGPRQLNSNAETKMNSQMFNPINVYAAYQLMDGLVFGIGVNNPYGLGTEWPSTWDGRYISQKIDLQSFYITPTIAYRIMDGLSVGAGFSYVTGKVTLDRAVAIPFAGTEPVVAMELDGTSYGFTAGVQWQPTKKMSVGASYRSAVKLDAAGTATFTPNYTVLALPNGPVKASLELPATGFFGLSYEVMNNLTIEADYQFVGWSSYKELVFEFGTGAKSISPKNYEDTYIIRVGGEYTMGGLQLRAGYLYDNSPVSSKYVEPLLPDANRNGFNVGFGYKLSKSLSVDVAYLFLKFDQREASQTEVMFDGVYNNNAHLLGINFNYSF